MVKSIGTAFTTLLKDVDERVKAGGVTVVGLPTGFPALDNALGGFRKKSFYFLGARTGVGKTAMALTLATNIAETGKSVWYASLEMPAELLSLRFLSSRTGIDARSIERGLLTREEYTVLQEAVERYQNLPLYIHDVTCNTKQLRQHFNEQQSQRGLDFAVIDYLTLFTDEGDSETQRLEKITGHVQQAAVDYDIPILGIGQLNREAETQEDGLPTLRNIRFSDRIAHDAFAVMFVHRPAYFDRKRSNEAREDDAVLIIDKNRQGPKGIIECTYYPKKMLWEPRSVTTTEPPAVAKTLKERPIQRRTS